MRLSPFLQIAVYAQAVPALTYLVTRPRTRTGGLLALGAFVSLLSNVTGRWLAEASGNNQLLSYISSPLTGAFFLAALAGWQVTAKERLLMQRGIFAFLVLWILLVAFVEDMRNFDLVTGPFYSLTLLAAASWTLIRRAGMAEVAPIYQSDWFWTSIGFMILGASTALASPLGAILIARERYDLFDIAWHIRAGLSTLAFLLVSWGIRRGPLLSKYAVEDEARD